MIGRQGLESECIMYLLLRHRYNKKSSVDGTSDWISLLSDEESQSVLK